MQRLLAIVSWIVSPLWGYSTSELGMLGRNWPGIGTHFTKTLFGHAHKQLGGFLKDFFRKFSGNPNGKYAILMDVVEYEVAHMKL